MTQAISTVKAIFYKNRGLERGIHTKGNNLKHMIFTEIK